MLVGGVTYPTMIEPWRLRISRFRVPLPGLSRGFDGFRIVHLTDLHSSRHVSADYLRRCIDTVNALAPDLVVLTGDYLTFGRNARGTFFYGDRAEGAGHLETCRAILAGVRARHGLLATLGNHDHWFDPDRVAASLQQAGLRVLRNEAYMLQQDGCVLPVVGLEDLWSGRLDCDRAFRGIQEPTALVLMHNPDLFETWNRPGIHLILAGHTHGGQVNLPWVGPPLVPSRYGARYAHGWFRRGQSQMYVSAGIGLIYPPVRFNCRPEIAVFELEKA